MVIRYYIFCPACDAKIVLRLSLSADEHQPFYFICETCGTPTRGSLDGKPHGFPPPLQLNLEDGRITDEAHESPDQIITIALDLPCLISGGDRGEFYFPFLEQDLLMGGSDKLHEFEQRQIQFRYLIKTDWPKLKRLTGYYVNRNWPQFEKEWAKIFGKESMPLPTNELQRHDRFHRLLETFFVPLQPNLNYLGLKVEINELFAKLAHQNEQELKKYTSQLAKSSETVQLQRSLIERLAFSVDHFSALLPGFPVLFYIDAGKDDIEELRIMRDDFEILKSHYLSSFEIAHKILNILVGLMNIDKRGNPDLFDSGDPKSLSKFKGLPNAKKAALIDSTVMPVLASQWDDYFDRQLRNSIGHYSVHHDLLTGMLQLDKSSPIPYSWFVASTLRFIPILLALLQIVKMTYITPLLLQKP